MMSMNSAFVVFFATPDEQLKWLRGLLADEDIWCVVKTLPPQRSIGLTNNMTFLASLNLTKGDDRGGLQLFLGRRSIVPLPIWRTLENGDRDIDNARSQAIQFDPATIIGDHILLSGQMAIMREIYYQEAGIDSKPLKTWFRQVARSLRKLNAAGTVIIRDPERGEEKVYPDIVATSGAIQWQRSGHLLKQFVRGAYEFYVPLSK